MKRIARVKINRKILIVPIIVVPIVVFMLFSNQTGGGQTMLSEAVEGGEWALTSVGRNHESLMQFAENNETQARQLLEAARVGLENAKAKLNPAGRVNDDYVQGMLDSYRKVVRASDVMSQGVNNLLTVSQNLTSTVYYYFQKDYEKASEQASYCLQILEPLVEDFESSNASLKSINIFYIPSGQRDQFTLRVSQFVNASVAYNEYVKVLRVIMEGKAYLQMNELLEEYLKQLQKAIAGDDTGAAKPLLQQIRQILESLRGEQYQRAADLASKLDPSLLKGESSRIAHELRNTLRNLEGIDDFQNYLESLKKYIEALEQLGKGNLEKAQQAINEGMGLLGQGRGRDPELRGLYNGLRSAFDSLQQSMKNPPPPG